MKTRTRSVYDPVLTALAITATVIGLLFIFDAGYARSLRDNRGIIPREFIVQMITMPIAMGLGWWAGKVSPDKWLKWSKMLWIGSLVGLLLVEVPGIGVTMNGAHRWIRFPFFNIQPAEFVKLTSILYLAGVLATRKAWPANISPRKNWGQWMDTILVPKVQRALPLVWVGVAVFLIEIEPDLGTAAIVAVTAFVMLIVGNVSWKSIATCVVMCILALFIVVKKQPYRVERITNHAARWSADNVDDSTYQTVQSEVAMSNAGIFGVGLGNGRAKHVEPATTTDFIMATIAEETGLIGSWIVLALMGGITLRIFYLAREAKERYSKLVLAGVGSWLGIQSCVNLMMANAFLPPIGIPMPFISSGGSSLIALWMAVGLCQAMLRPAAAKGEVFAISDHRWRYRRPHLSGARSRAALR
ncbi:MAG: cell division protein FtsW [Fimbriimonadaceae bacterium]|jgi:cell division protein FtsW|nr:cell division protein FtsW [Fimbriimonadaceae bacterium]